nr:unnamed protein product [Digitaria exilis]
MASAAWAGETHSLRRASISGHWSNSAVTRSGSCSALVDCVVVAAVECSTTKGMPVSPTTPGFNVAWRMAASSMEASRSNPPLWDGGSRLRWEGPAPGSVDGGRRRHFGAVTWIRPCGSKRRNTRRRSASRGEGRPGGRAGVAPQDGRRHNLIGRSRF